MSFPGMDANNYTVMSNPSLSRGNTPASEIPSTESARVEALDADPLQLSDISDAPGSPYQKSILSRNSSPLPEEEMEEGEIEDDDEAMEEASGPPAKIGASTTHPPSLAAQLVSRRDRTLYSDFPQDEKHEEKHSQPASPDSSSSRKRLRTTSSFSRDEETPRYKRRNDSPSRRSSTKDRETISDLKSALDKMTEQSSRQKFTNDSLSKRLAAAEQELETLKKGLTIKEGEAMALEKLLKKKDVSPAIHQEYVDGFHKVSQLNQHLTDRLFNLDASVKQLKDEQQALESRYQLAVEENIAKLNAHSALDKELRELQSTHSSLQDELVSSRSEVGQIDTKHNINTHKLEKELTELRRQLNELQASYSHLQTEHDRMVKDREGPVNTIVQITRENIDLQDRSTELQRELSHQESRIAILQAELSEKEAELTQENESSRSVLQASILKTDQLQSDLSTMKAQYESELLRLNKQLYAFTNQFSELFSDYTALEDLLSEAASLTDLKLSEVDGLRLLNARVLPLNSRLLTRSKRYKADLESTKKTALSR